MSSNSHRPGDRQNVTVDETQRERQYRLVLQGPHWSGREVKAALARIERLAKDHDYVVATGSLPPGVPEGFYASIARIVKRQGGRMILDTSGPPLQAALEAGVYLVKPNHIEFRDLAGAPSTDWKTMARVGHRPAGARQGGDHDRHPWRPRRAARSCPTAPGACSRPRARWSAWSAPAIP
jgi:fructose-1-phosphate kinase PfkB-like protein